MKKYVKSKLKNNESNKGEKVVINSFPEKQNLARMASLFREDGNIMFEYNKMKRKIDETSNHENVEKNNQISFKEKKINDWLDFKDKVKKEEFLIEDISYRHIAKDEEKEIKEGEIINENVREEEIGKKNLRPEENFYNKIEEINESSLKNVNNKKKLRVLDKNDIQNILTNNDKGIFHFKDEKTREDEKIPQSYTHLLKRRGNGQNNGVILLKPQIVSSEKQKFFQKAKEGEQFDNMLLNLISANKDNINDKKLVENRLVKRFK
jgi:hypothetical protein